MCEQCDTINTSFLVYFCFSFRSTSHRPDHHPPAQVQVNLLVLVRLLFPGFLRVQVVLMRVTSSFFSGVEDAMGWNFRGYFVLRETSDCWVRCGTSILRNYLCSHCSCSHPKRQIWTLNWISVPFLLSLGVHQV